MVPTDSNSEIFTQHFLDDFLKDLSYHFRKEEDGSSYFECIHVESQITNGWFVACMCWTPPDEMFSDGIRPTPKAASINHSRLRYYIPGDFDIEKLSLTTYMVTEGGVVQEKSITDFYKYVRSFPIDIEDGWNLEATTALEVHTNARPNNVCNSSEIENGNIAQSEEGFCFQSASPDDEIQRSRIDVEDGFMVAETTTLEVHERLDTDKQYPSSCIQSGNEPQLEYLDSQPTLSDDDVPSGYGENISRNSFWRLFRLGSRVGRKEDHRRIGRFESPAENTELIDVPCGFFDDAEEQSGEEDIRPPSNPAGFQGNQDSAPLRSQKSDDKTPHTEIYRARLKNSVECVDLRMPIKIPCRHTTPNACMLAGNSEEPCPDKVHFVIQANELTDVRLGDCSYLEACYNIDTCPYVHYETIPALKPKMLYELYNFPKEYKGLLPTPEEMLKYQDQHGIHHPVYIYLCKTWEPFH
jgi:hypothetical protein